jgi:hypothetical protein
MAQGHISFQVGPACHPSRSTARPPCGTLRLPTSSRKSAPSPPHTSLVRCTSPLFLPLHALPCLTRLPPRSLSPHRTRAPPQKIHPHELNAIVTVHLTEARSCAVPRRVTSRLALHRRPHLATRRPSTGIDLRRAKLRPRRRPRCEPNTPSFLPLSSSIRRGCVAR